MTRGILMTAAAGALVIGATAAAQRERLPAECRQQIREICQNSTGPLRRCISEALPKLSPACVEVINQRQAGMLPGAREYAYGADPKQRVDIVSPAGTAKRPLLVFVHGGGWSIGDKRHAAAPKAQHLNGRGWAFGSVNYRLVPAAIVEQQAQDVAAAVAYLRANAAEMGIDPDRIVLMGHSAGAHLAALVATDPTYFRSAGVPLPSIKGVVLLDGAGYDVAKQMAFRGNAVPGSYQAAFGSDPARQRALSPTMHAAAPNVRKWLILPVSRRQDAVGQSTALAAALTAAGAKAAVSPVDGESHSTINRGFGEAGDVATARVDAFLDSLR